MSCKTKFGVSFHSNMSIQDIAFLWCSRVTDKIKAENPDIDTIMQTVADILAVMKTARTALRQAKEIKDEMEKAQTLATATAAFNAPLIAQIAAAEVAEQSMGLASEAVSGLSVNVSASFTCPPVAEEDPKMEKYYSDLDLQLRELNKLMSTNLCSAGASYIP